MSVALKNICFLLLFAPSFIWCQQEKTIRDIGVWAGAGLSYNLNKNWEVDLAQEVRSFNNGVMLQKSITDLGFAYKINKQFKLSGALRYAFDRKKDFTFTNDMRYNIDFRFKHKLSKSSSFQYRFRFQHSYINLFTFIQDINQRSNVRNRIKFQYKLKKHDLFCSAEIFRAFVYYQKPLFNNLRLNIGDEINTRLGSFKYAVAYERELNEKEPLNFFFLRFNYTFKLKHD